MIESEFKVMLSQQQYECIHNMYEWDREITQTNFYYDTDDLQLVNSHITCRVRRIDGEHYLQVKLPTGVSYSRVELEQELGSELPDALSADMLNALTGRDDMPDVKLLGELTTRRSVKKTDGVEIDLDKSSYFGKTDYELEIEFADEDTANALLGEIAKAAGIERSDIVCLGKMHRFLEEFKKQL